MSERGKTTITSDADGLAFDFRDENKRVVCIAWSSVTGAIAYKRDLLIFDLSCLAVEVNWDSSIELDEQMNGGESFCRALETQIEHSVPFNDWRRKLSLPPFKTSQTDVYRRQLPNDYS